MKTPREIWERRNPQHECDDDGTDRFWKTLDMCFKEYASQFIVYTKPQLDELQEAAYKLGQKFERQNNCKHEVDYLDICVACGFDKTNYDKLK